MKRIVIEMSDARYKEFSRQVREIVDTAVYIEANVRVEEE